MMDIFRGVIGEGKKVKGGLLAPDDPIFGGEKCF